MWWLYLQLFSCLIYVICVCLCIVVYDIHCVLFFCFVCFRLVFCVSNVGSLSGLSIFLYRRGNTINWQSRETCNIDLHKTKKKHNTIWYVLDTTIRRQTQITWMAWAILQTTGGKDKPNIAFMWKSSRTSQHETQNVNTS